jgi:hypothetical protein
VNKKQKLSSWRITNVADINIDAVRKQKKAEYNKQYRLKRKLLLQQQASKDIYILDPVLSSLKMEGIFFGIAISCLVAFFLISFAV